MVADVKPVVAVLTPATTEDEAARDEATDEGADELTDEPGAED